MLANGDNGVGFYWLKAGAKVAAGKAYLRVPAGAEARRFIGFGDDTTGIDEELKLKSDESATTQYYDLQGRRVDVPGKGIYIVRSTQRGASSLKDGKKVVIK